MHLNSSLTTRQFERDEVDRPVEFVIAPEHRTQVKFGAGSTAISEHVIQGRTRDVSPGGIGIECGQFLPRMCEGTLRIFDDRGENAGRVIFEHRVKVRRVYMLNREPAYSLGVAFVAAEPDVSDRIDKLLQHVHADCQSDGEGDDA